MPKAVSTEDPSDAIMLAKGCVFGRVLDQPSIKEKSWTLQAWTGKDAEDPDDDNARQIHLTRREYEAVIETIARLRRTTPAKLKAKHDSFTWIKAEGAVA